jgi:Uma2 family endonuclease
MSIRLLHRFSVEDYHRMAEVGLIAPDARVELLEGVIIDMMPIGPLHGGAVNQLSNALFQPTNNRWIVSTQNPLHLGPKSEPVPDLMLLRPRDDFYSTSLPVAADVFLIVEVADSSLERDREDKLPIYAKAGIVEVWIVNLPEQQIEIYRDPNPAGYTTVQIARGADEVSPLSLPEISFPVARLVCRAR